MENDYNSKLILLSQRISILEKAMFGNSVPTPKKSLAERLRKEFGSKLYENTDALLKALAKEALDWACEVIDELEIETAKNTATFGLFVQIGALKERLREEAGL